jgi:hypothetical protein
MIAMTAWQLWQLAAIAMTRYTNIIDIEKATLLKIGDNNKTARQKDKTTTEKHGSMSCAPACATKNIKSRKAGIFSYKLGPSGKSQSINPFDIKYTFDLNRKKNDSGAHLDSDVLRNKRGKSSDSTKSTIVQETT